MLNGPEPEVPTMTSKNKQKQKNNNTSSDTPDNLFDVLPFRGETVAGEEEYKPLAPFSR